MAAPLEKTMKILSVILALAIAFPVPGGQAASRRPAADLPLTQNGGTWSSGHVQGIAVDVKGGYIYYSFTNLLARYDFSGRLVGTLVGWDGHLGDLDFNPADGKVYGSLEYKDKRAFYIAVIAVSRIDRVGIDAGKSGILGAVYLPEVAKDYSAGLDRGPSGRVPEPDAFPAHRYGCSGIDGVAFGPEFGHEAGPRYLTVAYGIYGDTRRDDNDHQVLVQYDVTHWSRYNRPVADALSRHDGPAAVRGKYFVRTGNTRYGVQNLAYDPFLRRWFLGVYQGSKPAFPNYRLFAVDAAATPGLTDLVGVPGPGGKGWEKGWVLPLASDGLVDDATGIRGWAQKADVGFQPIGGGLYYLVRNSGEKGRQTADLTLMRWTGEAARPFEPAKTGLLPSADLQ
ncbi:MAG: hypothetical protein ABF479_03960 [Gluconacetobacter sp.]